MSATLIGLTIIAVGTSLPELVTSIVAARKGESGLALGNAVGSCLMNIFCILGLSASLSAIVPEKTAIYDSIIVAAIAIVVYIFSKTSKKTNRAEGACLVVMYISYMVYAILR
jgi:cation:H+ antiporter